jgi:hypothetical protein
MNTVLEIRDDLDTYDRISIDTSAPGLRMTDRLALRVGLALLLWGRRHQRAADPAEAWRLQQERRNAERERERLIAQAALFR